jgi:hypothetical protein
MKRTLSSLLTMVSVLAVSGFIVEAAKPPPPPPPGPTPTGTIYYTTSNGFWAMNPDGTGKTLVSMWAAPGSRLNPDGIDPIGLYGAPCDQVHGSDLKRDRWYLYSAHTATFDTIIYPNGAVRKATTLTRPDGSVSDSYPENMYHYDLFAFRSDPANRNDTVTVQLTDLFGIAWCSLNGLYGNWSNDSNEAGASYVSSGFNDIRGCFYVDDDGNNVLDYTLDPSKYDSIQARTMQSYRLPMTGSQIQAAWELGTDINYRPSNPADLDNLFWKPWSSADVSPNGLFYISAENNQLVVRQTQSGAFVSVVWNGTSTQPKYPESPVWSRDGNTILFKNGSSANYTSAGGYWRVAAAGGTPVQLVKEDYKGFKWTSYGGGMWSPDSQHLSVTYLLREQSSGATIVTKDVLRLPAAGGSATNLTADDSSPAGGYRWVSNTIAP